MAESDLDTFKFSLEDMIIRDVIKDARLALRRPVRDLVNTQS